MVYKKPPPGFSPKFEAVGCFCEHKGRFIVLRRHPERPQGGAWGLPSGGILPGEDIKEAARRELEEETGVALPTEEIQYFGKVYVRYPEYDFVYHIFRTELDGYHEIKLVDREHTEFRWIYPNEVENLDFIGGLDECVKIVYF